MKSNRLFIVAPVYFDFESFIILRSEIVKQLKNFSINLEPRFVAVDDSAGEDCAVNELEKLEDVIVLKPPFNLGHQRAIVFGIRSCFNLLQDTDFLVTLDSDGEDRPEDLPNMLLLMQKKQEPLVIARRTERQESLSFKICYLFYKFFFKTLTGEIIRSGNYAVHNCKSLKQIIYHPYFDLCYSSSLVALKIHKSHYDCPRGKRYKGKSKMNLNSLVMHGIRMLMPFMDKIATRALILFSVGFALSLIFIGVIVFIRLGTDNAIPGWASYLLAVFSLSSFVALGNFAILFTLFTQGQGKSLRSLETYNPQNIRP